MICNKACPRTPKSICVLGQLASKRNFITDPVTLRTRSEVNRRLSYYSDAVEDLFKAKIGKQGKPKQE